MSTLLLIPWIIFGFKNADKRCIGLTQTKRTVLRLFVIEIILWTALMLLLDKPNTEVAGQESFAWTYAFIYEKGIFPTWLVAENINSSLGDKIDNGYQFIYLFTALIMDYVALFLISPRLSQLFKAKKVLTDEK